MSRVWACVLFCALGCANRVENGQECWKNDECLSGRCIQYVCVDPNASKIPPADSAPIDTGVDAPAPETATDSGSDTSMDGDDGGAG